MKPYKKLFLEEDHDEETENENDFSSAERALEMITSLANHERAGDILKAVDPDILDQLADDIEVAIRNFEFVTSNLDR